MTTFNALETDCSIPNDFGFNLRGHKGHIFQTGDEFVYFFGDHSFGHYFKYRIVVTNRERYIELWVTEQKYYPGDVIKTDRLIGNYGPEALDYLYLLVKEVQYDPKQQGDRDDDI